MRSFFTSGYNESNYEERGGYTMISARLRVSSAAILSAAIAFASHASAQSYPSKPVRMIVASSAGSNPDTIARVVANGLSKTFGQQVLIDNRPGAGGNIGAEVAARGRGWLHDLPRAHQSQRQRDTL